MLQKIKLWKMLELSISSKEKVYVCVCVYKILFWRSQLAIYNNSIT